VFFKLARCVPERFILGIVTTKIVSGSVFEYAPSLVGPAAELVRQGNFLLSTLALITSLGLLVSSLTKPAISE
jgi:hypothetical protein